MTNVGGWEQLEPLGEGGQSKVFLVRSPGRIQERRDVIQRVLAANPWEIRINEQERAERIDRLATALGKYSRSDKPSELGALKMFKIPTVSPDGEEAIGRLRNEILVLGQNRPGLVKLLAASEKERWMVTEYMPSGSLDRSPGTYKGAAFRALKAFRSIVETVASLHKNGIVHRDIKPANVFPTDDDRLVLGDFGIVYLPDLPERLTTTTEKIGPRDYMPQWGDLGERLENVQPNFDVYMLGKLLWCMVSGRLKLPREYHKKPAYDVTMLFPNDPNMRVIGEIVGKCVVEEPHDCLKSAEDLLVVVDEQLAALVRGLPMLNSDGKLTLPCRVCGRGSYREHYPEGHFRLQAFDAMNRPENPVFLRVFVCNVCTHYELFAPNFPDEAAQKGWTQWRPN
jgi:serine/threonine protein kinase